MILDKLYWQRRKQDRFANRTKTQYSTLNAKHSTLNTQHSRRKISKNQEFKDLQSASFRFVDNISKNFNIKENNRKPIFIYTSKNLLFNRKIIMRHFF